MFYIERGDRDAHTDSNKSSCKSKKKGNTLGGYLKSCQSAFSVDIQRSSDRGN